MLPKRVKIVEVGPRDGLQNEPTTLPTKTKVDLINLLSNTGLSNIELGSFVSEKYVPQMHDTDEVLEKIDRNSNVLYSVLVPNVQGMQVAIKSKPDSIAIFTAASDSFCKKNINCSIKESIERFQQVVELAQSSNIPVRGYVSCVFGCPYEGETAADKVADIVKILFEMGCYEVSLGDTIGVGTLTQVEVLISKLAAKHDINKLAVHFHDSYGQALVNVYRALQLGITTVDAAVAGLGGCPYAKGSSGNLATEDLLYMLNGLGIETGVDLDKLIDAGTYITNQLKISPRSKVSLARAR